MKLKNAKVINFILFILLMKQLYDIFMIDDTVIEADSLAFEGEIHQAGQKATAYVWLRFYPVLLKKF